MSLSPPKTLVDNDFDNCFWFVTGLVFVVNLWKGNKPSVLAGDVYNLQLSPYETRELEEIITKYYCQQFFNYFGRAAQIPHCLFLSKSKWNIKYTGCFLIISFFKKKYIPLTIYFICLLPGSLYLDMNASLFNALIFPLVFFPSEVRLFDVDFDGWVRAVCFFDLNFNFCLFLQWFYRSAL